MKHSVSMAGKSLVWGTLLLLVMSPIVQSQNLFLVKEVNTIPNGGSFPNYFTVAGTKLYFFAADNSGAKTLWVTQGTDATTSNLGPATGVTNSATNLFAFNGQLFFSYNDGVNGQELWTSNGTAGGTVLFKDLNTGAGNSLPSAFTVCNNKLFFAANNSSGISRLFVSDGTPAGTVDLRNASLLGGQTEFAVLNNEVYFLSDNGTGSGNGLWKSDGTPGGTLLVKANITPSAGIPGFSAVLNSKLYFNASDSISGSELWVSDGTTAGTSIVKNLRADAGAILASGNPQNLIVYNTKLYFAASDDVSGMELFSSDGTDAGTQLVKDIVAGSGSSQPLRSTVYNGQLYFCCWATTELWKTDGTLAGTQLVKNVLFTAPKFAATWNNKMYIFFGGGFYNLWQSDGTTAGTKAFQPQNTAFTLTSYTDFGSDSHFTEYNAELYLNGQCFNIASGFEPVKLSPVTPLPVTWVDVQGQWENATQAKISWQVADQFDVKDYTVQQSKDGAIYTDACIVPYSNTTRYSCIVPANGSLNNSYRVLQRDINGRSTYSKVVNLRSPVASMIRTYPNPAKDKLYVDGILNVPSVLKITDADGRVVKQLNMLPGSKSVDISGLPSGIYILSVISDKEIQTQKFIRE